MHLKVICAVGDLMAKNENKSVLLSQLNAAFSFVKEQLPKVRCKLSTTDPNVWKIAPEGAAQCNNATRRFGSDVSVQMSSFAGKCSIFIIVSNNLNSVLFGDTAKLVPLIKQTMKLFMTSRGITPQVFDESLAKKKVGAPKVEIPNLLIYAFNQWLNFPTSTTIKTLLKYKDSIPKMFKKPGPTLLFRALAVTPAQINQLKEKGTLKLTNKGLSSWTLNFKKAKLFANIELHQADAVLIIQHKVPKEAIFLDLNRFAAFLKGIGKLDLETFDIANKWQEIIIEDSKLDLVQLKFQDVMAYRLGNKWKQM